MRAARSRTQNSDLSLFFTDDGSGVRHFASFTYGPAFAAAIAPFGLVTDAGVGVGSTVAALRTAYPIAGVFPEDGFNGPGFEIETGLYGFLPVAAVNRPPAARLPTGTNESATLPVPN